MTDKQIKNGDIVKLDYEGKLDNGTVFDSTKKRGPFEFEVGSGQVIKGFDDAVLGMKEGEQKTFRIPPEQAYGMPSNDLIQKLPKEQLKGNVEVGMGIGFTLEDGRKLYAKVIAVDDEFVTIDLNPPLAGQALNFTIKILEIKSKE